MPKPSADLVNKSLLALVSRLPSRINALSARLAAAPHETLTDGVLARMTDVSLQELVAAVEHFRTTMKAQVARKQGAMPEEPTEAGGMPPFLRMLLRAREEDGDCDNPNCPTHGAAVRARRAKSEHKN